MFEFLQKSKTDDRIVLVFDIGSGSVAGAIVKLSREDGALPRILKSHRVEIKASQKVDLEVLLKGTIQALTEVTHVLHRANIATPEKVFCTLASPWYTSENRVIKMAREHPFVLTQKVLDEMFNKEITRVASQEIIEQYTMEVRIDGAAHPNPIGASGRTIETRMIVSFSHTGILHTIRETLDRAWPHTPITFSSFAVASYMAVRERYMDSDSYILLDVAGEISDVSIVTHGALRNSLSFPFGVNTLFIQVASTLGIDIRDARELVKLYISDNLEAKQKAKVAHAIISIENSWKQSFQSAIDSLGRTYIAPSLIFLTIDISVESFFKKLVSDRWKVVTLDGPSFMHICNIDDGPCDPFLMIESISVAKIYQSNSMK